MQTPLPEHIRVNCAYCVNMVKIIGLPKEENNPTKSSSSLAGVSSGSAPAFYQTVDANKSVTVLKTC